MSAPHVLVTGAASGIGRHLVGAWSARGDSVVATDVDETALARAATEDGWSPDATLRLGLDVRDAARWEAVIDLAEARYGPLDRVVNGAGYLAPDWIAAVTDRDIERHLDVNVKGVILGTRAAAKRMVPRGRGHIVNIGSLASLSPVPGLSLYSASKFAVRGFTLSVAVELAAHGVAVTLVMPDAVQTPMLDLQKPRAESAMVFSGGRVLAPADVRRAIEGAFRTRALEVAIPPLRGQLARLVSLVPALGRRLSPLLAAAGLRRQAHMRATKEP